MSTARPGRKQKDTSKAADGEDDNADDDDDDEDGHDK